MKRHILTFGLILGAILATNTVYMMHLMRRDPDFMGNDVLGYAAMIIVFSLVFFGIRNYRNKELGGVIALGRAFKTGALIAFLGSTIYVVVGLSYIYLFAPDFIEVYSQYVLKCAERDGATETELAAKAEEMAQFATWYKNPLFAILISYMEVLPIGLVVAFISALVLKKKPGSAGGRPLAGTKQAVANAEMK